MPKRLYALEGSKIQFFINATDPEGYPLKYKHLNTTTGKENVSISETQKTVTISRTRSCRVTLIVEDSGRKEINHTIEIHALPWSCLNGGIFSYIIVRHYRLSYDVRMIRM